MERLRPYFAVIPDARFKSTKQIDIPIQPEIRLDTVVLLPSDRARRTSCRSSGISSTGNRVVIVLLLLALLTPTPILIAVITRPELGIRGLSVFAGPNFFRRLRATAWKRLIERLTFVVAALINRLRAQRRREQRQQDEQYESHGIPPALHRTNDHPCISSGNFSHALVRVAAAAVYCSPTSAT